MKKGEGMRAVFVLIMAGFISGCMVTPDMMKYKYTVTPDSLQQETNNYSIKIDPLIYNYQFTGFTLIIDNKSDKPVEVDWNKTLFINDGQTSGGFTYEGIVFAERNNPKMPDIVFPRSRMSKLIYPSNLVTYNAPSTASGIYIPGGWGKIPIDGGNAGVYLTLRHEGKEESFQLAFDVTAEEVSPFAVDTGSPPTKQSAQTPNFDGGNY